MNNQAVAPHTNLQMVLNYLKQGHPVLPPQPTVQVPQFSPIMGMRGQLPMQPPKS